MSSIKDYWIEQIQNIEEFDLISNIEDIEITNLKDNIKNLIDNQFIQTATEIGIARREKLLNIIPFADDTLESRRFRISNRWATQLPYTYKRLLEKINNLVGENGYAINLNHEDYTLRIKINLGQKRMLNDIREVVCNMAPANLLIVVELQYNRYVDLSQYTHDYLNQFTFNELREEALYGNNG